VSVRAPVRVHVSLRAGYYCCYKQVTVLDRVSCVKKVFCGEVNDKAIGCIGVDSRSLVIESETKWRSLTKLDVVCWLLSFLLLGLATRANSLSKRVRGYADHASFGTLLVCHIMAQKKMPNESTGLLATTQDRVSTTECIGFDGFLCIGVDARRE
jgi:hypothetical protein